MPEAPIDEDRNTSTREDDVGTTADAGDDRTVDSVAQAQPVEFLTECYLRFGVSSPLSLHSP